MKSRHCVSGVLLFFLNTNCTKGENTNYMKLKKTNKEYSERNVCFWPEANNGRKRKL
jgi:hypothetical protein